MLNKKWVEEKIRTLRLAPSRDNGQNFLIEQKPLDEIIGAATLQPGEHVLEIGPGLGALTEQLLAAGARVTAIELDKKLAAYLRAAHEKNKNFSLIEGDVLRVATPEFLASLENYKVIANIPYHITSDIIRRFTETDHPPTRACFLIQKEVAERMTALPPDMNQLALFTQWFAAITKIATISRHAFFPAPEVDSAIIRLDMGHGAAAAHHLTSEETKELFSLIKRGFSNPRKQLTNNLKIEKTGAAHTKNFDFSRRAETLSHEEWITLLHSLVLSHKKHV